MQQVWISDHVEIYFGGNKCIDCLNTWNYDFMTHDKCVGCHLPVTCKMCMRKPKSFLKQEMLRDTLLDVNILCKDLWFIIMEISSFDIHKIDDGVIIYFIGKGSRLTQIKPNHFINYSFEQCWGCSKCVPRKENKNIIKKPKLQKPNPKNQNIKRQNRICMKNMKRKFF